MQPIQQRFWPDSQPLVERFGRDFFRQIPSSPGVYLMRDALDAVLYVGKAKRLRHRLASYRVANPDRMRRRTLRLLRLVQRIAWEECADETTALARESELLKSLKPKFNRTGVWEGAKSYLVWRSSSQATEMSIADIPPAGWESSGPSGSGLRFFRASLVRLLWYAHNAPASCTHMPHGWLYGRMGRSVSIVHRRAELNDPPIGVLSTLFSRNDTVGFSAWISQYTNHLFKRYDLEIRDNDLDTVLKFVKTNTHRVANSVTSPLKVPIASKNSTPFLQGADWHLL